MENSFFTATGASNGSELWKSDGTPAGTTLVTDIDSRPDINEFSNLTAVGSKLFFSINDATTAPSVTQLWTSDGSTVSTSPSKPFPRPI